MPPKPKPPPDSPKTPSTPAARPRKPSALKRQPAREQLFVQDPPPRRNDRTNRPTPVAPYSDHKGPHRDGYSDKKCRTILVRNCSNIPRNYNYSDGVHMVVNTLREQLGDENLDLSLGVLYEFIEVNDTVDTWEESSAYRRWGHDHSLRMEDLCCAHTLRLANIVVGTIQPTQRLKQWRKHHKRQLAAANSSPEAGGPSFSEVPETTEDSPTSTTHGIRNRHSWQINHSFYVSSPNRGTNVLYCPTPRMMNEMAFMEGIARGQRENQSHPNPQLAAGAPVSANEMPLTPPPTPTPPVVTAKKSSTLRKRCKFLLASLLRGRSKKEKTSEDDVALTRTAESTAGSSDNPVEDTFKDAELMNGLTRTYIEEDGTFRIVLDVVPLPEGVRVNGVFSRKFGIVNYEDQLPIEIAAFALGTADDKVLKDEHALKVSMKAQGKDHGPVLSIKTSHLPFNGPFTAELFKDGGLDFRWKPATATVAENDADAISPASAR